jgi:hypothetical protein
VSLRPTDEIDEDGWQCLILGRDLDISKVAESEDLIFEAIASAIPTEITFTKLVWVSEFRCVCIFSTRVNVGLTSVSFRANIRMVNKFSEGRVFVAGGM